MAKFYKNISKNTVQPKNKSSKNTGVGSPSLQSAVGNQEYGKMLMGNVQAKLTVGSPNDIYEKEADAVAEKVVNMTDAQVQSKQNDESVIQAKGSPGGMEVPAGFESDLNSIKGTGVPINKQFREGMESRMNAYFGDVRIHTGNRADKLARSINAEAFTAGHDIVFAARNGRNLESREGKKLLGHELTHVLQQKKGVQRKVQRKEGWFAKKHRQDKERLSNFLKYHYYMTNAEREVFWNEVMRLDLPDGWHHLDKVSKSQLRSGNYLKLTYKGINNKETLVFYMDKPEKLKKENFFYIGEKKYKLSSWENPAKRFNRPLNHSKVSHGYYEQRKSGLHRGLDIVSSFGDTQGRALYSIGAGRVTFAYEKAGTNNGSDSLAGTHAEISFGNGRYIRYLHMSSINVKSGQWVNGSTLIGTIGNTGYSKGAHLHLTYKKLSKELKPGVSVYGIGTFKHPNEILKKEYLDRTVLPYLKSKKG